MFLILWLTISFQRILYLKILFLSLWLSIRILFQVHRSTSIVKFKWNRLTNGYWTFPMNLNASTFWLFFEIMPSRSLLPRHLMMKSNSSGALAFEYIRNLNLLLSSPSLIKLSWIAVMFSCSGVIFSWKWSINFRQKHIKDIFSTYIRFHFSLNFVQRK